MFRSTLSTAALASCLALGLSACKPGYNLNSTESGSGDFEGVGGDSDTRAFFGPGSHWELILDDGDDSFTLKRKSSPTDSATLTLEGEQIELSNGYTQLSVDVESGDDADNFTYADDIAILAFSDDTLILTSPEKDGDQLLVLVSADSCPTENVQGNWVTYKQSTSDSPARASVAYFGDYQYSYGTDTGFTSNQFSLVDAFTSVDGETFNSDDCGHGLALGDNHHQYLGGGDTAIIHTLDSNNGDLNSYKMVFAQKEIITRADIEDTYSAIVFDGGEVSGSRINTATLECDSAAICVATLLSDFVNDEESETSYTFDLSGSPDATSDGFITGNIELEDSETTPNIACMVNLDVNDEGIKTLACVGQAPGASSKLFNIFAISN